MNYSRKQLYALGEPLGESATARKLGGGYVCGGGGGGSNSTTGATTTTNNTDQRQAVQDGIATNGDGNIVSYNSSDAVVAIANAGADIIKQSGGAVVDIYKNAGQQNTDAWNTTLTQSGKLVDKLIDQVSAGFGVASKAIDSFQPAENKNTDAIKWAAIAAGVVGVSYLFNQQEKK